MKHIKLIILSSFVCFASFASENKDYFQAKADEAFNKTEATYTITDKSYLTLESGEKILPHFDIRSFQRASNNRIDSIELNNGSIYYDHEIRNATIILNPNEQITRPALDLTIDDNGSIQMRVGGDGSGGG